MTLPVIYVVGALMQDEAGRYLLAQRPANKKMPFLWEVPGGKIDAGETPEQALVRELHEEIGVVACSTAFKPYTFVSMTYSEFHIILLVYTCSRWTGIPTAREGQGGLEWVRPEDMDEYPMPEANRSLISLLKMKSREQNLAVVEQVA
ncbi:MAG: (deoxy)nucleoside triphosphate pyrophosphohydrolase [Alphaproteobacteria bacterium]|jgi:8-oxo-dGTP diphosphatase|nr:(deoxy)nucleoside triphosphate pyrophosphohydrolase [Alphaproteobacteria bacterium]